MFVDLGIGSQETAPPVYEKDTMISLHGPDGAQPAFAKASAALLKSARRS
jgi:hypothetical protein